MNNSVDYSKKLSSKFLLKEKLIKYFFALNGFVAVLFILLIFGFLINTGFEGFNHINLSDYFFSKSNINGISQYNFEWYPTSENSRFSIIPLLAGTLLTAIPAVLISTLIGIIIGIYLAEAASPRTRELLKPIIEIFAGVPTVVIGFFMLVVGATILNDLFFPVNRLNAFLASLGLSFIVIPIIASLTEDSISAVPRELRMASYALGANRWQTIIKVVLPASVRGISAAVILGFGRAIGETMIVLMASGNAAVITVDVFRSVRSMTATIAAELGEVSQSSPHYFALFFIGLFLFSLTFILNLIAEIFLSKMRKKLGN
ncbi:MAG: phosphate ABC transporter permease subunit PstC [Melioribacteraceae bacterium]|jgi:phosphate transport system permease protein|nr:phosphate ABC transporter permease subunit PstC [Melioribacteraceae bacterium]